MLNLTLTQIEKIVGGRLVGGNGGAVIKNITLDSRKAEAGSLFVAIRGERVDGHDCAGDALKNGAVCTLCEKPVEGSYILVESSLRAMQRIAAHIRETSGIPVIAVTGSVGKTSTRQMLSCVLSQRFDLLSTEGNFNNEFGLPQTLFKLEPRHELAMLELGISRFGEMTRLAEIARPNYAVITNIGNMHLENLGDRDGVLRAKTELVAFMPPNGRLFLNGEDDKLRAYRPPIASTLFGMGADYPIHPLNISQVGMESTHFTLCCYGETAEINLPATGTHMVLNAVAAANVAHELGMSLPEIKAGIESYSPVGHRGRILRQNGITIVDDCYNAGPDSMRAAIASLAGGGRRIALLGDMLELGRASEELHLALGGYCAGAGLDALFTVGVLAGYIAEGARRGGMREVYCPLRAEAASVLHEYLKPGDVLLVKASRGMRFETLIDALLEKYRS